MSLQDLRREIDAIDSQILELLSRRAGLAQEVGRSKARTASQFFAPDRERQIFDRLTRENPGPLPRQAIMAIFREIISASRALEQPIRVAFLGPLGTFSHQAAMLKFGNSSEAKPVDTIPDVFREVERGQAEYGVVPVENSTDGVIKPTLDMFAQTSLRICAEVFVPIHHHLATRAGDLGEVKRLYANPEAFAQCRVWVREHLPKIEVIAATSNSKSAQMASVDSEGAAICTDMAAEIYNVPIIRERIEDSAHNRTRFLVIGENKPKPSGKDKTSIYFSVAHKAGALLRAMSAFSTNHINLTMIESRPTKQMPWEYVFFIDFHGHVNDPAVVKALDLLREQSLFVTVLGSYPEAE